jgi:hypothetical protein
VYTISCSWVNVGIFLCPFIWNRTSGLIRFYDGTYKEAAIVHQILCKSLKKCDRHWQWLDIPLGKKAWAVQRCLNDMLGSGQTEGETAKNKVKSMLIIFFASKWIVHKEFILAGQTVNSTYYCDVLQLLCENVQRLRPKLWQRKNLTVASRRPPSLYYGWMHPVAHVTINKYNNPSFATMSQHALLNTYNTTCFGLNPSHHQVLSYTEY